MEAEAQRAAAVERAETLAKSMKDREVTLDSANEKIAMLEARLEERRKSALDEGGAFEERIARLTKQFEAEAAARSFAEGALHTARQERSARLKGSGDGPPREELSAAAELAPAKVAWMRR
jgi:chromosome segregation ATPase